MMDDFGDKNLEPHWTEVNVKKFGMCGAVA